MSDKEYIENQVKQCKQLIHGKQIIGKDEHLQELEKIRSEYFKLLKFNVDNKGFSENIIKKRVKLLNDYYNFLHDNKYDNLFSSQSKFRSSILEEFMYFLFRDYIEDIKSKYNDSENKIHGGSVKAYANLYFSSSDMKEFVKSPTIKINEKDQDFAIYRSISIQVENSKQEQINLPIVAIENKSYIDKTMLDSTMAIADKLKQGNPYVYFAIVTETYEVDFDVDPFYSNIDQIYVLRKSKRKGGFKPIDDNLVVTLFNEVKEHIERPWSDVKTKMEQEGLIMPK